MNYKEMTDEELLERLRQGEQEIMDYILDKYKNLVRKRAKDMFLIGGDEDDLIQEGMIGLFKAVRDYRSDRDASFFSFADICISRQIYTAIQASNRLKHVPLNTYISLYSGVGEVQDGEEERQLIEQLQSLRAENPENMVIEKEQVAQLRKQMEEKLSKFEQEVLLLYLSDHGYETISRMLDKPLKSVDNALQRARAKLKI